MTSKARELLVTLGAEKIEHPGGTLLAHLERVSTLLREWGASPTLQLAGLCHAFYGTDGFPTALLPIDRRDELAEVIGGAAEQLVYFYASCDRQACYATLADDHGVFRDRFTGEMFTPSVQRRRDFVELTAANELDIARISADFRAVWGPELLEMFAGVRHLLTDSAWGHCQAVLVTESTAP